MASASKVRKRVTIDVEIDIRCGEKMRFNNTFREERNLLWRDWERKNRIVINQLEHPTINRGLIGYLTIIRKRIQDP